MAPSHFGHGIGGTSNVLRMTLKISHRRWAWMYCIAPAITARPYLLAPSTAIPTSGRRFEGEICFF